MNCPHQPPCPSPDAPDREAARVVAAHPEQGWSLLCNGVVALEDTGYLLPDGRIIPPHRDASRILRDGPGDQDVEIARKFTSRCPV